MVLWVCSKVNDIHSMLIGCVSLERMRVGDRLSVVNTSRFVSLSVVTLLSFVTHRAEAQGF